MLKIISSVLSLALVSTSSFAASCLDEMKVSGVDPEAKIVALDNASSIALIDGAKDAEIGYIGGMGNQPFTGGFSNAALACCWIAEFTNSTPIVRVVPGTEVCEMAILPNGKVGSIRTLYLK